MTDYLFIISHGAMVGGYIFFALTAASRLHRWSAIVLGAIGCVAAFVTLVGVP